MASDVSERVTFVLGAPRSGTTWLAKVLDSHPTVLYRHEPDIAVQDYGFPTLCEEADIPRHTPAARRYMERLLGVRTLKVTGGLPLFPKAYHSRLEDSLRLGAVLGLQAAEQVSVARAFAQRLPVPDFADAARDPLVRVVMKSVSALGRAGLYAQAMPHSRFLLILRHPCGQVASMLRGKKLNKFEEAPEAGSSLLASTGHRYGLTPERFAALSLPEQHAWDWAVMNEFAMEGLERSGRLKVVIYEDFCAAPQEKAREIFDYLGFDWSTQTQRFLDRSTSYSGRDRYYQIYKNTQEAMHRWRSELAPDVQAAILAVARQTRIGRMFA